MGRNERAAGVHCIGQAKDVLMERFRLTAEVLFTALVKASADSNVKLRTVCQQLRYIELLTGKPPKTATDRQGGPPD